MKTLRIKVYGIVQGVGMRPVVARHATRCGITGTVSNLGPYVEIYAQGEDEKVDEFLRLIEEEPPKRAAILKIDYRPAEDAPVYETFEIIESGKTAGEIFVSPDIAMCDECLEELFDKNNRRYLHPFINCTCCGPRLTILDALPYDRERTSMKEFPMCERCASEYYDPATRRYDAQPVCCNDCGPEVFILDDPEGRRGRDAITYARKILAEGGVIAVKGIGGFHLACSAKDNDAVMRLRQLKSRPAKPFAVMMKNMDAVDQNCITNELQREILTGHQKPILLLRKKEGSTLAEGIAPGNPTVGVMLPYAPVQSLLFDYDDGIDVPDCLVMTSGNISGLPICRDEDDARREIARFCDAILTHNRKIRIRADDSVMDFYDGKPYMIRRSRGYAPLPYMMTNDFAGSVIAYGGELKNTFCIGVNNLFYPSSYIGDLTDLKGKAALKESVERMEVLLETKPALAVCDLHPRYNSSEAAEESGLPLVRVQHHYAHVLSCMAENDFFGECIGVSFDGTGYGTDGTIWGGEIMRCDLDGFDRLFSIRPFLQTGGDIASREGWRIAVSMLMDIYGNDAESVCDKLGLIKTGTYKMYKTMHDGKINSVVSTSAGRLFDAVSAILGIRLESTFEGEAATSLMYKAMEHEAEEINSAYVLVDGDVLATDSIVKDLVEAKLAGGDEAQLAYRFHYLLAKSAAEAVALKAGDIRTAALSGGCYQNTLLLDLTKKLLEEKGFKVLIHSLIPPNDGGISLGQALYGMNKLMNGGI
ncbi:MAG: carbamoyltransferase HypF [Clostridiales bacterium]|nr:carbamoyltransferase HypF [Clostridiales bacterium]